MSCGVGCRHGSDLVLLWLWRRPAAVVLTQPLAWEPPYAAGAALKTKTKKKEKSTGVPWWPSSYRFSIVTAVAYCSLLLLSLAQERLYFMGVAKKKKRKKEKETDKQNESFCSDL